jgi:uncharacterized damage-inducible protein DinB
LLATIAGLASSFTTRWIGCQTGSIFQQRRLFFGSVHGTLNHILLAERIWHGRFIDKPHAFTGLDQELVTGRVPLRDAIFEQCTTWDIYLAGLGPDALDRELRYTNTHGRAFAFPLKLLLAHVFNHATHHRGQVSAALTQAGLEAPVMDIPYFLIEESAR